MESLNECIKRCLSCTEDEYAELKKESYKLFNETYTENIHYKKLIRIYENAMIKHHSAF